MKKLQSNYENAYQDHIMIFKKFAEVSLVAFHNFLGIKGQPDEVLRGILQALKEEYLIRKIDFSNVLEENSLSAKYCSIMVDKKLFTISQLPHEIVEGLLKMYLKTKGANFGEVEIIKCEPNLIQYSQRGNDASISPNVIIRSFTNHLLTPEE